MEVSLSSERERCGSAKNVRARKKTDGGREGWMKTTERRDERFDDDDDVADVAVGRALGDLCACALRGEGRGSPGQLAAGLKKKRGMGKATAHRSRAERQVHDVKKQEHAGGGPVSRAMM